MLQFEVRRVLRRAAFFTGNTGFRTAIPIRTATTAATATTA
jgi:hypothetical protein